MQLSELKNYTKDLHILYAEDSLTVRNITKKMLSEYFTYIDVAKDGEEALKLYQNYKEKNDNFYDIVFTDLEMPIMDGQQLSMHILDFNANQEIVIISGIEDFKKAIEIINLGIKKFITKPTKDKELYLRIKDVVQSIKNKQIIQAQKDEIQEYNAYLKEKDEKTQKELHKKVRELEEFIEALNISALVVKTDAQGIITYVNELFCELSAYSKNELIGKNINI